jgi:hypothetical protein
MDVILEALAEEANSIYERVKTEKASQLAMHYPPRQRRAA